MIVAQVGISRMSIASERGGKRAILLGQLAVVPDFARRFPVETSRMSPPSSTRHTVWRHVPNALSLARIVCAPVLILMAAAGEQSIYTWVLVPARLTDAADGWFAFQRDVIAAHRWLIGALFPQWRADVKGVWWVRPVRIPRRPHRWPTS